MHSSGVGKGAARRLAADLRADILHRTFEVGDRIAGEHELMSRFSVSRQTVREALRELHAEGLVTSRCGPRGGVFVAAPELDRLSDLLNGAGTMIARNEQFRYTEVCVAIFEIEAACCRLAANRCEPAAIAAMRKAIRHAAGVSGPLHVCFDAYTAFNHALWAAAGNEPLAFVMRAFMLSLRHGLPKGDDPADFDEYRAFLLPNHTAITDAIAARDGAAAVSHLRDNMRFWLDHPPADRA